MAWSAFVERGLAVQIASADLALDVNGAFTGQENLQFSVCFTDRKLSCLIGAAVNAKIKEVKQAGFGVRWGGVGFRESLRCRV